MNAPKKVKKRKTFFVITFFVLTTFLTLRTFKKVNSLDISIFGSELFSVEDIVTNSSLNLPTPLIFIKTKYTEKELIKNLSLKNVSVNRQLFPFGLKILIKTRTPIAYGERILKGEKITGFIDEDGYFISNKYSEKENLKKLTTKVYGWEENSKVVLSKILDFQKNNDVKFIKISFSSNGFITLEEKSLKTILLGFNPKLIKTQIEMIGEIKNQMKGNIILKKIDNIDLTDPNNPKIKVFKP